MFCKKCGAPLDEEAKFCAYCGEKVLNDQEIVVINNQPKPEPKKVGFKPALASTILGGIALSLLSNITTIVSMILSSIGLILGIIGLVKGVKNKKNGGSAAPMILGIVGTSLSAVSALVGIILAFCFFIAVIGAIMNGNMDNIFNSYIMILR